MHSLVHGLGIRDLGFGAGGLESGSPYPRTNVSYAGSTSAVHLGHTDYPHLNATQFDPSSATHDWRKSVTQVQTSQKRVDEIVPCIGQVLWSCPFRRETARSYLTSHSRARPEPLAARRGSEHPGGDQIGSEKGVFTGVEFLLHASNDGVATGRRRAHQHRRGAQSAKLRLGSSQGGRPACH